MREILFRGKRVDNGEWVYGVPIKDQQGDVVIVESVFECEEYNCRGAIIWYVDEKTVAQYTGLTDKNGKKIFDGDIIQYVFPAENAKPDIGVVKFTEYKETINSYFPCGFVISWINDRYLRSDIAYWTCYKENKIEVIGNIHDNPELLKGENDESEG